MQVVIIEDEHLVAKSLEKKILASGFELTVQAVLESVEEAISYFEVNPLPDLFFSDIQLSDGLSFEIFEKIQNKKPVIFCTAYEEYTLRSFKSNGIDYIIKPFSDSDVRSALSRYFDYFDRGEMEIDWKIEEKISRALHDMGLADQGKSSSLLLYQGNSIVPVRIDTIGVFYLENGVLFGYSLVSGNRLVINKTLEEVTRMVGRSFRRVNRQAILNKNAVKSVSPYFSRKLKVILKDHLKTPDIIVSKANSSAFLRWLEES